MHASVFVWATQVGRGGEREREREWRKEREREKAEKMQKQWHVYGQDMCVNCTIWHHQNTIKYIPKPIIWLQMTVQMVLEFDYLELFRYSCTVCFSISIQICIIDNMWRK